MNRLGRITGQGPGLLRRVLVQVAWGLQRRTDTRGHAVFERLCHGQRTRRKQAVVALARKILIWCWALLLRDGSTWDDTRVTGERRRRRMRNASQTKRRPLNEARRINPIER
jgi:transposase